MGLFVPRITPIDSAEKPFDRKPVCEGEDKEGHDFNSSRSDPGALDSETICTRRHACFRRLCREWLVASEAKPDTALSPKAYSHTIKSVHLQY